MSIVSVLELGLHRSAQRIQTAEPGRPAVRLDLAILRTVWHSK